jgi:transposase-like protein
MNEKEDTKEAEKMKQEIAKQFQNNMLQALSGITLGELLGMSLSSLSEIERKHYLRRHLNDKGNGFYPRNISLGSIPVTVDVPRVRSGQFHSGLLPGPYERGYKDSTQALILNLLSSSRSLNSAKKALKKMGIGVAEAELEEVSNEFIEEIELRNTAPIDPDMLGVFIDGKYIEVKEGDRLRKACIYVVVGLNRQGYKKILGCYVHQGQENLDAWRKVLRSLIERGLRRVMILVQDDFSGLLKLSKSLFPNTDIQLCTVHMKRNSKSHLNKIDAKEFIQRFRSLSQSWDSELAAKDFDEMCDRFEKSAPHFIAELRKKRKHYLYFVNYPTEVRRPFSTTNLVEAVNGSLEKMKMNNGGYFQSENNLKMKLSIVVKNLEDGSWKNRSGTLGTVLNQLNAIFEKKFESELMPDT